MSAAKKTKKKRKADAPKAELIPPGQSSEEPEGVRDSVISMFASSPKGKSQEDLEAGRMSLEQVTPFHMLRSNGRAKMNGERECGTQA